MTPWSGTRPAVGFNAASPQKCAGSRTLAPESVPRPKAEQPAAIAAASPPLDPPTECDNAYGLLVRPKTSLVVSIPPPNQGQLVLPRKIAPAASTRPTASASASAVAPRACRCGSPAISGAPATAMLSLTENGRPDSGPGRAARAFSAAVIPGHRHERVDRARVPVHRRDVRLDHLDRRDLVRGDRREQFGGRPVDELHRPTVQD